MGSKRWIVGFLWGVATLGSGASVAFATITGQELHALSECETLPGSALSGDRGQCTRCLQQAAHHFHPEIHRDVGAVTGMALPEDGNPTLSCQIGRDELSRRRPERAGTRWPRKQRLRDGGDRASQRRPCNPRAAVKNHSTIGPTALGCDSRSGVRPMRRAGHSAGTPNLPPSCNPRFRFGIGAVDSGMRVSGMIAGRGEPRPADSVPASGGRSSMRGAVGARRTTTSHTLATQAASRPTALVASPAHRATSDARGTSGSAVSRVDSSG